MINDPKEIICSLLLIIVRELKILVSSFEKQNINGKPYFIFKAFLRVCGLIKTEQIGVLTRENIQLK